MSGTTAGRLAGIASFMIDGTAYQTVGDLKYRVSKVERETLKGVDGIHGYKEMPTQGYISAQIRDSSVISVASFNQMVNVTVQAVLANGKTVSGTNMWCVEAQEVDAVEGTFDLRFEGVNVIES